MRLGINLLLLGVLLSVSATGVAQTSVIETVIKTMRFGDWQVRCEKIGDQIESCVMSFNIIDQKSGTEIGQANFAKNDRGTLMTLVLPLGIYLVPGVTLEVKEYQKFNFPITFCTREGCFVNELVSEEFIDLLRKKEAATLTIGSTATQNVELPFSINGFLDAYKKL
jgi:invasion protein IalB